MLLWYIFQISDHSVAPPHEKQQLAKDIFVRFLYSTVGSLFAIKFLLETGESWLYIFCMTSSPNINNILFGPKILTVSKFVFYVLVLDILVFFFLSLSGKYFPVILEAVIHCRFSKVADGHIMRFS